MDSDVRAKTSNAVVSQRIGWIGAGKMGAPMIRNLIAGGVSVAVTEPSDTQLAGLIAIGATNAATPADHTDSAVVFSTLPNDQVLLDVVIGHQTAAGLATTMVPGSIFVEMSTVSPECSAKVAAALEKSGILYLRAPLSGSTTLAEQGTLTILASGDEAAWKTVLPIFELVSARQFFLGAGEEARFMKLVLNTLVGATSAVLAEALSLGRSGGLSYANMMEVICESAVASPLLKYKADAIVAEDYAPAFAITQMIKDFTLISEAGREQGVPLFTTSLILELYRAAANSGLNDKDFFALVKWHSEASAR